MLSGSARIDICAWPDADPDVASEQCNANLTPDKPINHMLVKTVEGARFKD